MTYDYKEKKIVATLCKGIEIGVALNVVGHLSISIGAYANSNIMGRPILIDGSGTKHVGISRYPFIITTTNHSKLKIAIEKSREMASEILMIDYPKQMLYTGHDDELSDSLSSVSSEDLEYLGAVFYGDTYLINQLTGKFSLWR